MLCVIDLEFILLCLRLHDNKAYEVKKSPYHKKLIEKIVSTIVRVSENTVKKVKYFTCIDKVTKIKKANKVLISHNSKIP